MAKAENKETRYFVDLDLKAGKIIRWDYADRSKLTQSLADPGQHRVFITRG